MKSYDISFYISFKVSFYFEFLTMQYIAYRQNSTIFDVFYTFLNSIISNFLIFFNI